MQQNQKKCINSNSNTDVNNNGIKKHVRKALFVKLVRNRYVDEVVRQQEDLKYVNSNMCRDFKEGICLDCRFLKKAKGSKEKKAFRRQPNYARRMELDLKSLTYRVKKLNKLNHLITVMRKLREKENNLLVHMRKNGPPAFRVVSKLNQKGMYQFVFFYSFLS